MSGCCWTTTSSYVFGTPPFTINFTLDYPTIIVSSFALSILIITQQLLHAVTARPLSNHPVLPLYFPPENRISSPFSLMVLIVVFVENYLLEALLHLM
jgi:hypothetical protein